MSTKDQFTDTAQRGTIHFIDQRGTIHFTDQRVTIYFTDQRGTILHFILIRGAPYIFKNGVIFPVP